jgi:hypothetical protein
MGYLTGLGELILYEIFHIVKPHNVLLLENDATTQQSILNNIENNITSGKYTQRLYFQETSQQTQTSTIFEKYINNFASQKAAPERFSSLISRQTLKSL